MARGETRGSTADPAEGSCRNVARRAKNMTIVEMDVCDFTKQIAAPLAFLRNLWEHFPKGTAFGGKKIHQQRNLLFTESQDQRSRASSEQFFAM
jgi:hypothetical protein